MKARSNSSVKEIDVDVTYCYGGIPVTFFVECKNLHDPAKLSTAQVLSDTIREYSDNMGMRAILGILVSPSGIQSGIRDYVSSRPELMCFTYDELEQWLTSRTGELHNEIRKRYFDFYRKGGRKSFPPAAYDLTNLVQQRSGRIVSENDLDPLIARGISILNILFTFDQNKSLALPDFAHASLDGAVQLMRLLEHEPYGNLITEILLGVLTGPCDANSKTVAAHLARRFTPFGKVNGVARFNDTAWEGIVKHAKSTIIGATGNDALDVEHNVAYLAAMHGSEFGKDNVLSIEGDRLRLEALLDYNRVISYNNPNQLLAMLNKKNTEPPPNEIWVKAWAGKLLRRLR